MAVMAGIRKGLSSLFFVPENGVLGRWADNWVDKVGGQKTKSGRTNYPEKLC